MSPSKGINPVQHSERKGNKKAAKATEKPAKAQKKKPKKA